jgi:hypothetical protein
LLLLLLLQSLLTPSPPAAAAAHNEAKVHSVEVHGVRAYAFTANFLAGKERRCFSSLTVFRLACRGRQQQQEQRQQCVREQKHQQLT